jgi:hypothetical protein
LYTFTPTAGLCATTATLTITVNPNTTPTFAAVPAICAGASLSALPTTSTNGVTGTWAPALNNAATTLYTFTPTAGLCATTATLTISVNPAAIGGAVNGGTTICKGSSSDILTLTGYTGNIIRWESAVSPFTIWTTITNLSNTYTSGILNETTQFRAVVQSGSCNIVNSTPTIVTIGNTTWNGTSWSNGIPTSATTAIISGNYNATSNLSACSLTVNNNAVVIVKSGYNFNIYGDVTVNSGSSLTFENNTNLIQSKNTNGNSGDIIIRRQSSPLMRQDYIMWSAPVALQQLQSFSPATLSNRFYTYDPLTDLYVNVTNPATTNFALGTGYLIRVPNNHPTTPTIWEGQFKGVPNNGNYNLTVNANKYNAIGNPYPSTVDADAFIIANGITEALYFWRKTNNTNSTSYATYTLAGGTANTGGGSTTVPNGKIQVGQGFLVKATSNTILLNNAMRIINNDNQFFKSNQLEKNRIWLNLSTGTTAINQMMIAYMKDATTGIDIAIDGKYINDNQTALTSNINEEEYVIQGRSLPFEDTDVVPLNFKTNIGGSFTIDIDHVDGLFSNKQKIFLKDNLTGIEHDIKTSAYTFDSAIGTFNNRFQIVYKNSATLEVKNPVFDENSIILFKQNEILNINTNRTIMKTVRVFDIRGRLILEQENVNATTIALKNFIPEQQALLIQITSDENKVVIKKTIY